MITLTVDQLKTSCAQEITKYLRNQISDDRFCLELFRRAVLKNDQEAWVVIVDQYKNQIFAWIKRTAQYLPDEEYEDLWAIAVQKFLKYAPGVVKQSNSIGPILGRLRDCATNTAIDYLRSAHFKNLQATKVTDAHTSKDSEDAEIITLENDLKIPSFEFDQDCDDLRKKIMTIAITLCRNEADQIILAQIYIYDKPPREVFAQFPHLFSSMENVNKVHRNLKDRLSRNENLKALLPLYQDCE